MIRDVSDLKVYQESLNLLPKLYLLVEKLPRSETDLIIQSKRAAKSIPANIAEGFAKRVSVKEFKRFLKIAIASSDEVITHLKIVSIVEPNLIGAKNLAAEYKTLSKRINALSTKWQSGGIFKISDPPKN